MNLTDLCCTREGIGRKHRVPRIFHEWANYFPLVLGFIGRGAVW
jgi:ABC-type uncharacterized transport system ATPase subunit